MRTRFLVICLVLLSCVSSMAAAATKPAKPAAESVKPTREAVLAIAEKYIKAYEPKLAFENRQSISKMKTRLDSLKAMPGEQAKSTSQARLPSGTLKTAPTKKATMAPKAKPKQASAPLH